MNTFKTLQKGFTLIELAIVGLFLGLLTVFTISTFNTSATNSTRIKGLVDVSSKISTAWGTIVQYCEVTSNISGVAISSLSLGNTSRSNLAYILGSDSSLNTSYASCVSRSGIKQLSGVATGAAGSERIQNYAIASVTTIGIAGRNYLAITYANVPEDVVLTAYNMLSSATGGASATSLPVSDTTDSQLRFSAVSSGTRSMTIISPV